MGKLKAVGLGVKALEDAFNAEQAAQKMYTAADRAKAGNKAADLIKTQKQVKASEALGQSMEKGYKKVSTTQSDRTRVGGGNIGGANFSAISEADPEYARKVWGVMDEGTASRLTNLSSPETIWTTMLGSSNQLKSNPVVFDKLKKQFIDAMKEGKLSPELENKFNHNLALTFGEGAQIRDPNIWKEADTFEKRAALADLMMGQGITPKKGGIAMGGEKSGKGVIFKPTETLVQETEPSLLHPEHGGSAPTFALGPRLFNLSGTAEYRPDLHPGFPMLLHGEDLGYNFEPVPTEVFLPTWHKHFRDVKPERFQGPWSEEIINRRKNKSYKLKGAEGPGYYDLALGLEGEGLPSQELNDEYIRHLIREGYAKGGEVHMAEGGTPRKYVPPSQLIPIASQEFPLQKPANTTESDMTPTEVHPLAGALSRGVANVHDFVSKPFGFSNPPMEIASEMMGLPAISKTLENYAYGTPNTSGSGQATRLNEEAVDAAMSLPLGSGQTIKAGVKSAVKGAKELAPTAGKLAKEFAEKTQFGMPLELNVVPPTEGAVQAAGKAAEVKAPANDLGLYSVVEKAALNLQRKSGNGDAFLSDLMKNQGVSQARLDETGLTEALKGRKGVTREEVQQLAAERKIPLEERIAKESVVSPRRWEEHKENIDRINDKLHFYLNGIENLKTDLKKSVDMYGENNDYASQVREKIKVMEQIYKDTYSEFDRLNKLDLDEGAAKYGPKDSPDLNTAGGKNYREILIKTPISDNPRNNFGESHHDDKNVLMHMRVADHTDVEGKSGLLVDELQSDWHQKGRKRGYADVNKYEIARKKADEVAVKAGFKDAAHAKEGWQMHGMQNAKEASDLYDQASKFYPNSAVPDAPYKDNWYEIGLKRAIKEAVDSGKDRLYLTKGNTQANRYGQIETANSVSYHPDDKGRGMMLNIFDKNDRVIYSKLTPEDKVANVLGEEATKKLMAETPKDGYRFVGGLNTKIGGEGMRQYYDKNYRNYLKKYARQHGSDLGEIQLSGTHKTRAELSAKEMHDMEEIPEFKKILDEEFAKMDPNNPSIYQPWNAALKRFGGDSVYYIDLNPQIKKSAKKGQGYAEGGAVQSHDGFDYESHVNKLMDAHNLNNFDYEGHVNKIMNMAEGGLAENTIPDESDGGLLIQAPTLKNGGRIPLLTR
jgi:hypothetical protein